MHIITGMLVSLLFSRGKKPDTHPLLDLRWPIKTRHVLPGRIRFQIPLLAGQEKTVSDLTQQLKKIDGIHKVHCNAVTGSVLLYFDDTRLQPELLFTVLIRLLGLEKELERTPEAGVKKEISRFSRALNQAIYTKTDGLFDLKTITPLSLGLLGIYRLFSERPLSMPSAVALIWWAYSSLIQNNRQDDAS